MPSVYDRNNFAGRVNYAAQCFIRGTSGTRHFDTCFEMHDGDLVVTALVHRAQKNKKLYDAIAKQWRGTFPQQWLDTAAKYSDVPTRKLAEKAAEARREAAESFDRWMEEQRKRNAETAGNGAASQ